MNEHSSRSHCLLRVTVEGRNLTTGSKSTGLLNLVDLAGSERLSKTNADGERLREARSINRSLACLGDVMHALRTRQTHVPYRNSKLTYLLQDSLGGDSKTLMIVQVAPGDKNVGETLCTLTFGQRVRAVELGAATKHLEGSNYSTHNGSFRSNNLNLSFRSNGTISPSPSFSSCTSLASSPSTSPSPSPCPSPSPSLNGMHFQRTLSSPGPSPSPSPTPSRATRRKLPTPNASPKPTSITQTTKARILSSTSFLSPKSQQGRGIHPISLNQSPLNQKKWISTPALSSTSSSPSPSSTRKTTSRAQPLSSSRNSLRSTKTKQTPPSPSLTFTPISPPSSPPMSQDITPRSSRSPSPIGSSSLASSRSPSPNDSPTVTPTSSPRPMRRSTTNLTTTALNTNYNKINVSRPKPLPRADHGSKDSLIQNNDKNENNGRPPIGVVSNIKPKRTKVKQSHPTSSKKATVNDSRWK